MNTDVVMNDSNWDNPKSSRRRASVKSAVPLLAIAMAVLAASAVPAVEPASQPADIKATTIPERLVPEPAPRGKPYTVPATKWEQRPVLWGWTCELPDGSGLSFGGIHQTADDGNPHTSIRNGGVWQPMVEELRKANPLQKHFGQARKLRDDCKDTLATARHIFFEGQTPDEEARLIRSDVDLAIGKLAADLTRFVSELKALKDPGEYESGQVTFALKHLAAAAGHIRPFGGQISPEQMATMRKAQIEIEIAAEAFDAEPPPRTLSRIAFEPKTRLFVIFGGDHMDYLTNDLWVFDPVKRRWFQRHPESAPEPRGDHHFDALGDGRIAMRGGYFYEPDKGYINAGPERWIYDVGKNTWSADGHREKTYSADTRSARYWPPARPEQYMKGPRPDAAANEARLKAIPVNTWVRLKTPAGAINRDWATWAYDPDRDMLYVWAGGHASYPGNDVARYHIATDRWEISDPVELPLGCAGTDEQYPSGFDFHRRPWCRKHVWNSQAYDPGLKKMVMNGANDQKIDPYFYLYDPEKADWVSRHRNATSMGNDAYNSQLRHTKHGMLDWYGNKAWLLDAKTLEWRPLTPQGRMPGTAVDSCGMVYDPKRDRVLFATLGGYAKPFDGQIHALDMAALKIEPLNPEGMSNSGARRMFLREAVYLPDADLFLWPGRLAMAGEQKRSPNLFPAYDPARNRWVTVKLAFVSGEKERPFDKSEVSTGIAYDARRGLVWLGDSGWGGGVWVMRFDASKAEIAPLKDFVP